MGEIEILNDCMLDLATHNKRSNTQAFVNHTAMWKIMIQCFPV